MLILTGCSSVKPIEVKYSPVNKVKLELPKVDELKLDPVDWKVITRKNAEKVFDDLEKKNYDPALFGLTDKGYENLSVNIARIRALIEQQRAIINAYDKYQKSQDANISEFNKEQKQKQASADEVKKNNEKGTISRFSNWKFW